jgi:hypothetical protein
MNVEIFTLCDAATDTGGKLNILGAFDRIYAVQTPAVHPLCAIAARIRFVKIEEGKHRLNVNFGDADGKLVLPGLEASLGIVFRGDDTSAAANVVLYIHKLKLDDFGEYTIDLAIDGRQEVSIPLYVCRRPDLQEKKPDPPPA